MRVEFRSLDDGSTLVLLPDATRKRVRRSAAIIAGSLDVGLGTASELAPLGEQLRLAIAEAEAALAADGTQQGTAAPVASAVITAPAGYRVAVTTATHLDLVMLLGREQHDKAAGTPFLPMFCAGAVFFAGPLILPGDDVSVADVYERLLCSARSTSQVEALLAPPYGPTVIAGLEEQDWLQDAIAAYFHLDGDLASRWTVLELDAVRRSVHPHPILPMPHRARAVGEPLPLSHLDDPLLGIITRSERVRLAASGVEGSRRIYAAQTWVTDLKRLDGRNASALNAGFSYDSHAEAATIATGEAVERYCANCIPRDARFGTEADLAAAGLDVLCRTALPLFGAAQYERPGFPYQPPDTGLPTYWVRGRRVAGAEIWAPAAWMLLNYHAGPQAAERQLHPVNYAGIAAGASLDACLINGIEELVERDTMMTYWLGAAGGLPLPVPEELAGLLDSGKSLHVMGLPNEFGIPVVCAVIEDHAQKITVAGYACRSTVTTAVSKAFSEAVALCETAEDLLQPDGLVWNPAHVRLDAVRGRLAGYRGDRRYRQEFAPDYSDVTSLFAQLQLCLDPEVRAEVREVVLRATVNYEDWCQEFPRTAQEYLARVSGRVPLIYADLTTPDIAPTGLRVARVASPELLSNFATAFPPLGNGRAARLALQNYWPAVRANAYHPNPLPIPYA